MSFWLSRDLGNDDENNFFSIALFRMNCICLKMYIDLIVKRRVIENKQLI